MALIHSFESSGNWLFRRRSYLPLILFLLAIPAVFTAGYGLMFPLKATIIGWAGILISAIGLAVRSYTIGTTPQGTSGRNTEEQVAESLNSTGIYSIVRHPLYLGNYLMWIGIVIYTLNFSFVIIVSLMYWLYYERIMFAEERFLEKKFGQAYLDWSLKAPAFIPAFKNFIPPVVPFSFISVLRREYSGFFATVLGFVFVDVLRNISINADFEKKYIPDQVIVIVLAGMLTLILRTLKHNTNLLNESGRS
ncbi:MAG TPA: isoprenylcysteine carboxylmethyltransferase family protein [Bacteroidia bacterium]|nr:isoprenylcysteine carboxylmethyltransferase family protein [Bacteroidia bacterium]